MVYDEKKYCQDHRLERIERAKAWNKNHYDVFKERQRLRLVKFKKRVFDHYGKKCDCCGETIEEFLTVDHLRKNGKEHRREAGNGAAFYKWIVDHEYPSDLRILCMNCNYGERRRLQCPHQLDKPTKTG